MIQVIKLPQPSKTGKMPHAPPKRTPNSSRRSREYLTPAEVAELTRCAGVVGKQRHAHRDTTLVLLMYRHGLRVGEVVTLRRDQVDLEQGLLHVNRLKSGTPAVHPLRGPEIRALRKLFREYPDSPYVFSPQRGGPMTAATARKIVARAGELAEVGFPVHPHMLRHATGYYLASKGQDTRAIQAYIGHVKGI